MPTSILPPGIRLTAGIVGDGGNNEIATFTDTSNIQGEGNLTFDGSTLTVTGALTVADGTNNLNIASHDGTNGLALAGTVVTATAAQLNYVNTTAGVSAASKAIITDSNGDFEMQDGDKIFFGTDADSKIHNSYGNLYVESNTMYITSSTSNRPIVQISNSTNDALPPTLWFVKDRGANSTNGDNLGSLQWYGDNGSGTAHVMADIFVDMDDVSDDSGNSEDASINMKVIINGTLTSIFTTAAAVMSGDFNDTSDVMLKDNIEDIDTAIDTVKQLRPVTFDWKIDDREASGFIAQEVEKVFPNIVTGVDATDDGNRDDHKSIKTIGLLAQVTKAVQESIEKIETLEAQVKELQEA